MFYVQIRKGFFYLRPEEWTGIKPFRHHLAYAWWWGGGGGVGSEWQPRWLPPPLRPHFPLVRYKHDAIMIFFCYLGGFQELFVRALAASSKFIVSFRRISFHQLATKVFLVNCFFECKSQWILLKFGKKICVKKFLNHKIEENTIASSIMIFGCCRWMFSW